MGNRTRRQWEGVMMSHHVKVVVSIYANGKRVKDSRKNVRLSDDELSLVAGNLAYGLAEDAWELFPDEDEEQPVTNRTRRIVARALTASDVGKMVDLCFGEGPERFDGVVEYLDGEVKLKIQSGWAIMGNMEEVVVYD